MTAVTQWEVYYDDGTTITSEAGLPVEVRLFGIVCIAQRNPGKARLLMHGWDYWHEEDKQWWGCDLHGLIDRLLHRLPVSALLQGRAVTNEAYNAINYCARN
jgi:hypothetical protein